MQKEIITELEDLRDETEFIINNEDDLKHAETLNLNMNNSDTATRKMFVRSNAGTVLKSELETNVTYKDSLARKRNYIKYKDDTNTYDSKAVNEVLDSMPSNRNGNRTVKQACYEVVQGGCLLVYYNTVNDFLKELNCQLSDNDETNWSMYKKLVVNRMEKMYEKYTK